MNRRFWGPLGLLAITLSGVSCVRFTGPEDVRQDLSRQAGVKLKQETGFTFTRSAVWLARHFVKEEDFTLEGVRRIEIGVYEVKKVDEERRMAAPLDLTRLEGWEPVVRVHEPGEDVMVLTKQKDDVVRGLLVVVAESDEWVLVRIRGKLDRVLEQAIEMAFRDVERPDLYAKTRLERGLDPPATEEPPTIDDVEATPVTASLP